MPALLPFAVLACAALAAAVFCSAALWVSRQQHRAALERAQADRAAHEARWESRLHNLEQRLEDLAAELQDCQAQIPQSPGARAGPGRARSGLNLTKRAQALRMHRRGDPPDQIATLLELPLQEVDLLLKVHHIVLGRI